MNILVKLWVYIYIYIYFFFFFWVQYLISFHFISFYLLTPSQTWGRFLWLVDIGGEPKFKSPFPLVREKNPLIYRKKITAPHSFLIYLFYSIVKALISIKYACVPLYKWVPQIHSKDLDKNVMHNEWSFSLMGGKSTSNCKIEPRWVELSSEHHRQGHPNS